MYFFVILDRVEKLIFSDYIYRRSGDHNYSPKKYDYEKLEAVFFPKLI